MLNSDARFQAVSGALTALAITAGAPAKAEDFTAGIVMEKMKPDERFTFLSGVIEGLAYARYVKDGKTTDGMGCIYDWFYSEGDFADQSTEAIDQIELAFLKYKDYTPGALVGALIIKRCGA